MKFVKALGIILLILFVLAAVASFLLPKTIHFTESIVIDAPSEMVWNNIISWKERDVWSPWKDQDSKMVATYEGMEGSEGSKMEWNGDTVGSGSQTITEINEAEKWVKSSLTFKSPRTGSGNVKMSIVENGDSLIVIYDCKVGAPMPSNLFMTLFGAKDMLSRTYANGLNKMKKQLEEQAAKASKLPEYKVLETTRDAQKYIGKREIVSFDSLKSYMDVNMPKYGAYFEQGATMIALVWKWDLEKKEAHMTTGISTGKINAPENFELYTLEAGKYLEVDYYGDYAKVGVAHKAIDSYMKSHNLSINGAVLEEYLNNPRELEMSEWHTKVVYPVIEAE